MTNTLSREQVQQYERDGIVFPIKVFTSDEVSDFRAGLDSIASNGTQVAIKRLDSLHLFFDWAHRLVTNETLLNAVEDVLGSDILVYGTLVFYKPPRDASYASWHQDSFYSGLHLSPSTSAWVALTASHKANGCMRAIPGSHSLGPLDHDIVSDDPNLLNRRGERVVITVDESRALDVELEPGEMSLHHSTIVHGSNPNESEDPRIGFIIRFVTSSFTNKDWPLLRVRGKGDCGHLKVEAPFVPRDPEAAFSAWRRHKRA